MSYTIGQISQKMNLSEYTIRYYEKEGLFPFITRNNRGERIFDERDLHFLYVILRRYKKLQNELHFLKKLQNRCKNELVYHI